ncbi:GAF domain-containing protein [Chloroflexus sp.]|uniref:GAF domain-containing protein n=1 Tax=Chloroflexus sp. TaxID=1904827 RepID=UPI00298EE34B|nr:HD domain-containing phosphohydrolase [Chloroflexus sp.]MDW8404708.1 GAF domain-containing protein [Chloroflexus sp.]
MASQESRLQQYLAVIQRANQIAASTQLDDLLDRLLDLIIEITEAEAGTLYLYDSAAHELIFKVVKGSPAGEALLGCRLPADTGLAGYALQQRQPFFVHDVANDPRWNRSLGEMGALHLRTMFCIPLMLRGEPVGVVQVFNLPLEAVDEQEELALIELLTSRLVTEVEKARLLAEAQQRERRQQALVEIVSHLTATLERDELLRRIMNYACELLEVEAASIWLIDHERNDLVLHIAGGEHSDRVEALRVPRGQGIIGHVIETGETVVVNDVHQDRRFYQGVDQRSGFQTRAILCVPLRSPRIVLGGERGEVEGMIIGGAQALNPRNGRPFAADDVALFQTLASQAATVIRLAELYRETDSLFTRIIDAITGAIDLKDPYTRGHSQRVSDFSVAIAHELGLPRDQIYQLRVASKLHDVGKIRVPDHILKKPGQLEEEEFAEMRRHPIYGMEFLRDNGLLDLELLRNSWTALAQHHERLDGRGYPFGLRGEDISLFGRIVAVADVFDALTSHRPYRPPMPIDQVFALLRRGAGTEFDPECVEALIRAWTKGKILTQDERERAATPPMMEQDHARAVNR